MSKAILLSIKPQFVAKILNGEKTIEIRKHAIPVGTKVYIYCTKSGYCCFYNKIHKDYAISDLIVFPVLDKEHFVGLNGKVVASFVISKCEDIKLPYTFFGNHKRVNCEQQRKLQTKTMNEDTLLKKSCLTEQEIYAYLNFKKSPNYCGSAWHISQLKIFDRPKELNEFQKYGMYKWVFDHCHEQWVDDNWHELIYVQKAPQSFVYVEEVKDE